jgi:hypothetical protein
VTDETVSQLEETIYRLRRLHGVLDAALLLASEALYESVGGGLTVGEWHDTLIARAMKNERRVEPDADRGHTQVHAELAGLVEGLVGAPLVLPPVRDGVVQLGCSKAPATVAGERDLGCRCYERFAELVTGSAGVPE